MPSSTSNSSPTTPRKADGQFCLRVAAYAVAIILVYNAFIAVVRPRVDVAQNQWVSNRIAGERFIYRDRTHEPALVMVGSSIAAVLPLTRQRSDVFNLGLNGGSAATGLALLATSDAVPRVVAIEVNLCDSVRDDQYLADLERPARRAMCTLLPGLRAEYQPINLALSQLKSSAGTQPRVGTDATPTAVDEARRDRAVAVKVRDNAVAAPEAELTDRLAAIARSCDALRQRGCRVLIVRMPIHPLLSASPRMSAIVAAARRTFAGPGYTWLELSDERYPTRDGIHLAPAAAAACAEGILAAASRIVR